MPKIINQMALQAAMNWQLVNVLLPYEWLVSKGVYQIRHLITNKIYIGATTDCFLHRFRQHQCGMVNFHNREFLQMTNTPLANDFVIQGSNFYHLKFEIIEKMPTSSDKDIFAKESFFILTLNPEYNEK